MKITTIVAAGCLALVAASCNHGSNPTPPVNPEPDPEPVVNLGDPRDGLTDEQLAAFERGREIFLRRWKPSEGLGPFYNATSCQSCHSKPVAGGGSDLYRNFYVATYGNPALGPTFLFNLPGLPSPVVPAFGEGTGFNLEGGRVRIPETFSGLAVQTDQRNGISVFGTGLFETISDTTILANSDPDDLDADGISGRANNDGAGLGRFGSKAQSNNIELFTRAPLFNQMGISSDPFLGSAGTVSMGHGALMQGSSMPNARTLDADGVSDPEISPAELGDLIAFSRFLAPPQPTEFDDQAKFGEELFESTGCTKCHIPALEGSLGPVRAYTDLLLHDMGDDLAGEVSFGTPQIGMNDPATTAREWRTAPLWGISHVGPYLHDGRAPTLDEAILLHGGEAAAIRDSYAALEPGDREAILAFLGRL